MCSSLAATRLPIIIIIIIILRDLVQFTSTLGMSPLSTIAIRHAACQCLCQCLYLEGALVALCYTMEASTVSHNRLLDAKQQENDCSFWRRRP